MLGSTSAACQDCEQLVLEAQILTGKNYAGIWAPEPQSSRQALTLDPPSRKPTTQSFFPGAFEASITVWILCRGLQRWRGIAALHQARSILDSSARAYKAAPLSGPSYLHHLR